MDAISKAIALQLCAEIREENRGKWYRLAHLQCWGCMSFTKGGTLIRCV